MSAAVVSTSVIGSAATTIHVGRRIGRRQLPDLVAERPGVGEEQRRVEPEEDEPVDRLALGVDSPVVVARQAVHPAELRRGTASTSCRKTFRIEMTTAMAMPGRTPRRATPPKAASATDEVRPALVPEPHAWRGCRRATATRR